MVTANSIQQQEGSTECRVFSIAAAYHCAMGDAFRAAIFQKNAMWRRLLECGMPIFGDAYSLDLFKLLTSAALELAVPIKFQNVSHDSCRISICVINASQTQYNE